jgi:hypothetical protein
MQPEDDLDNRFITEGVVPTMKNEKRKRQFIFSTHNANIPVLGDAELIIGLSTGVQNDTVQGRVSERHLGSIDIEPVREMVEEILEGARRPLKCGVKNTAFKKPVVYPRKLRILLTTASCSLISHVAFP